MSCGDPMVMTSVGPMYVSLLTDKALRDNEEWQRTGVMPHRTWGCYCPRLRYDSRTDEERARDAALPEPTVTIDAEGGPWYVEGIGDCWGEGPTDVPCGQGTVSESGGRDSYPADPAATMQLISIEQPAEWPLWLPLLVIGAVVAFAWAAFSHIAH